MNAEDVKSMAELEAEADRWERENPQRTSIRDLAVAITFCFALLAAVGGAVGFAVRMIVPEDWQYTVEMIAAGAWGMLLIIQWGWIPKRWIWPNKSDERTGL